MRTAKSKRRYEFDWLRVSAILVVFLYHSTRFFNLGDWHAGEFCISWDASLVSLIFIFICFDLLSLVYLVTSRRAEDSESDHISVCHVGIDLPMVYTAVVDHQRAHSRGNFGGLLRWLGIFVLYLVSDRRLLDCIQRPPSTHD